MKKYFAALLMGPMMALALDIPTPDRAQLSFSASEPVEDYPVPAGPVQQAAGELRIENPISVSGDRLRKTFELPRRTPLDKAFESLKPSAGDVLFECAGRECGRSNLWANDLYQIRTLYGRDRDQRYRVVRQGDTLQSLYLVQRGNKRVYAHFEQIQIRTTDIKAGQIYTLDARFSEQNRLSQTPDLSELQAAIERHPDWTWRIMVRVGGVENLAGLSATGLARSKALQGWLAEQGVTIPVLSQGPLGGVGESVDQVVWMGFRP